VSERDPIDVLKDFLSEMAVSYTYDDEKKLFLFKANIKHDNGVEVDYPVAIGLNDNWIIVQIAIADLKDAPANLTREKILEGALSANYLWPEVSYALNDDILVSIAWSHRKALNIENFRVELDSVVLAAKHFGRVVKFASDASIKPPKQYIPIYQ
jgi:hypothetical protein